MENPQGNSPVNKPYPRTELPMTFNLLEGQLFGECPQHQSPKPKETAAKRRGKRQHLEKNTSETTTILKKQEKKMVSIKRVSTRTGCNDKKKPLGHMRKLKSKSHLKSRNTA